MGPTVGEYSRIKSRYQFHWSRPSSSVVIGIGGSSSKPRGRGRCCCLTAQTPNRDGTTRRRRKKKARRILLVVSIPYVVCSWRSVEAWFVTIVCCFYRCGCEYSSFFFYWTSLNINSIAMMLISIEQVIVVVLVFLFFSGITTQKELVAVMAVL